MRKSFVSKDKENIRYWFFFCMKNLTPRRLNFWRLVCSNSCLLGPNCVEMLHPSVKCDQVPVGCRGRECWSFEGMGALLNYFLLLELLLLHRRVCLYGLLQYLCYSCWVRGGVDNWSCCNKLTFQQKNTKLMRTYYCACVTTLTRSECNIPINCRCLMCVSVLQYTRAL